MEIQTLQAEPRTPHGSRAAQRLRRRGKVPAVIYGHQQAPETILVDQHALVGCLEDGAHVVTIALDGKTETCLLKDVQYDHLGIAPLHVDFARIDLTEKVRVRVALELRGTAKGQSEGGIVIQQLMDLDIECLATAIPDSIRVPINDLALDQILHVRELVLPEGVRAVADPEAIVAICREPHVQAAPTEAPAEAAAATEPEVIARGKIEEEGEAEGEKS
ncbi:MAG: 50S ribosomal protein L25 [Phycisphaerae bacterium]|nr:50S ribosomal protein L25 [Phycisphaerae bacterium]